MTEDPVGLVRAGYDQISDTYRADIDDPAAYQPWTAQLLASLRPGSRVLDLGCGHGIPRRP